MTNPEKPLLPNPEKPLIWTALGNVPEETLVYDQQWEVKSDSHIKLTQSWTKDGVLVKQNVHVLSLRGVTGEPIAGGLGGGNQPKPTACPFHG